MALRADFGAHLRARGLYLRGLGRGGPRRRRSLRAPPARGELLLSSPRATPRLGREPLETALASSRRHETTVLLSDAYTATGRLPEATDLINVGHRDATRRSARGRGDSTAPDGEGRGGERRP
jgi:hypothetical protein